MEREVSIEKTVVNDVVSSSPRASLHSASMVNKTSIPQSRSTHRSLSSPSKKCQKGVHKNPFQMPKDNDIFSLMAADRLSKEEERQKKKRLKLHEKLPPIDRITFRDAALIPAESDSEGEGSIDLTAEQSTGTGMLGKKHAVVKESPEFVIKVTQDRAHSKETVSEYIEKKREMFLLQYSLAVKRVEMEHLEQLTHAEERKLEFSERYLEEDAAVFDEFLKDNDKTSVEAIKIAEEQTKVRGSKVNEIKRLSGDLRQIKSEITRIIESMKDYRMYRKFLERLVRRETMGEATERERLAAETLKSADEESDHKVVTMHRSDSESELIEKSVDELNEMEKSNCDLTSLQDPKQVLDVFTELEESNLSLIQNCQETEEHLEEMKRDAEEVKSKLSKESDALQEQIERVSKAIAIQTGRIDELKLKARMFTHGDAEQGEELLEQLIQYHQKRIEDIYRVCISDTPEAALNPLQMLTNIESRIEELCELMERLPPDRVEAAYKTMEKARRSQLKRDKAEELRQYQEERLKKAIERSKEPPRKQTGRRLVSRSQPPVRNKKADVETSRRTRDEEDYAFYFT